ncbi:hypothetical protein Lesp02_02840 [Lentzea sp. NBRC 105346]|uniref:hypothetical protein n=1 Tax=Lentzea sp. NBRC 105346 TaxID=3032205 RepID=UPI0024A57402|nr:hypothetical protein [Lentzea sp. NBRC 105346]GLZ28094.1 hypothetical protein Lesp02_02840 [Lentzea sp. NBRC 105346]
MCRKEKGRVVRERDGQHIVARATHIKRLSGDQGHPSGDAVRDLALLVLTDSSATEAWFVSELIAEHSEKFGVWARNPVDTSD